MDRSTGQTASNTSFECTQSLRRFPEVASATWTRLQPLTSTVQHDLHKLCAPILAKLQPYFHQATQWTDTKLADLPPWQIAVLAVASTWLALTLYRWVSHVVADVRDVGESHSHKECSFAVEHVCFVSQVQPATLEDFVMLTCPVTALFAKHMLHISQKPRCTAGVLQTSINTLKALPILSGFVRREVDKVLV